MAFFEGYSNERMTTLWAYHTNLETVFTKISTNLNIKTLLDPDCDNISKPPPHYFLANFSVVPGLNILLFYEC
jgi:hypothetical protein